MTLVPDLADLPALRGGRGERAALAAGVLAREQAAGGGQLPVRRDRLPYAVDGIGAVYRSLPDPRQRHTVVIGDIYRIAAAVDRFGPESGLPEAYRPSRGYHYLAVPPADAHTAVVVGFDAGHGADTLRRGAPGRQARKRGRRQQRHPGQSDVGVRRPSSAVVAVVTTTAYRLTDTRIPFGGFRRNQPRTRHSRPKLRRRRRYRMLFCCYVHRAWPVQLAGSGFGQAE